MDVCPGYSRDGSRLSHVADVYGRRPNRLKLTARALDDLNLQPGCELLEVGCGEGMTSAFLAERLGAKVIGVDLDARILGPASERMVSGDPNTLSSFCLSDTVLLPFSADHFDYIWCESTLSTLDDKTRAVAEFLRLLKPGGKLIVLDFVLGKSVDGQLQKSISFLPCLGRTMTAHDYCEIFENSGFTTTAVIDYSGEIKKSGYWLGMMFGSLDAVISQIATGNCCSTAQGQSEKPTMVNFQRFLREAQLGYLLFVASSHW